MNPTINPSKRNGYIDVLKFFMAAIVVFTHTASNFVPPNRICYYLRWSNLHFMWTFPAVEVFAVISSFYLFTSCKSKENSQIDYSKIPDCLKKYIKIYCFWSIIYIPDLIIDIQTYNSLYEKVCFVFRAVFITGLAPHMWYLLAFIYSITIIYFFLPYVKMVGITILSSLLYALSMFGSSYYCVGEILGLNKVIDKLLSISGNLFILRIPLVTVLGLILAKYINKKATAHKNNKIYYWIILYAVLCSIQFIERKVTFANGVGISYPAFFATPFVAIVLLGIFLCFPKRSNVVTNILGEASSIIYFSHWLFKEIYTYFHGGYCGYAFWIEMIIGGLGISIIIKLINNIKSPKTTEFANRL